LQAIEQNRVRHLIIDITGVPVVDSYVGQGLIQVVQSARLLGANTLLVGIRPEVAQALVELGLDLRQITTYSSLQSGIAAVLAQEPVAGGR
jgi:rsbT co-antagonist protein RsbR